eukprot:s5078_g4.t1
MVRIADMQSVLGRLSFAFTVLPMLRPFLGPLYARKTRSDGMVRIADMQSVLGRLSFAFTVLPMLRPFLGPLYAWTSAVSQCHTLRLPKAIDLILVFLEALMLKGLRVTRVAKHSVETAPELFRTDARAEGAEMHIGGWAVETAPELFRTDARAEGAEMHIGGWACADSDDPRRCRWFAERIEPKDAPLFFMAGESYRSISSLELLATMVAVLLFVPSASGSARTVCSAGTDNKGNSHIVSRWLTTSFPLVAVLMELTAVLLEKSCMLELTWAPRLQNVLADSLTKGDYKQFDPKLRMRFSFAEWFVYLFTSVLLTWFVAILAQVVLARRRDNFIVGLLTDKPIAHAQASL